MEKAQRSIQEDAFGDVETDDLESITERFCEFKLPEEDFADMLYERRFEKNKSSSPGVLSGTVEGRASTVEDTEGLFSIKSIKPTFPDIVQNRAHRPLHHSEVEEGRGEAGVSRKQQEADRSCRQNPRHREGLRRLRSLVQTRRTKRKMSLKRRRRTMRMMRRKKVRRKSGG